jgi:hypothetical protein
MGNILLIGHDRFIVPLWESLCDARDDG